MEKLYEILWGQCRRAPSGLQCWVPVSCPESWQKGSSHWGPSKKHGETQSDKRSALLNCCMSPGLADFPGSLCTALQVQVCVWANLLPPGAVLRGGAVWVSDVLPKASCSCPSHLSHPWWTSCNGHTSCHPLLARIHDQNLLGSLLPWQEMRLFCLPFSFTVQQL